MTNKTGLHTAAVVGLLALSGCGDGVGFFPTTIDVNGLQGVVNDAATGRPIEGATVTLADGGSKRTTSLGHYEFIWVAEGTWMIRVTHPEYQTMDRQVTITPVRGKDTKTEANVSLNAR